MSANSGIPTFVSPMLLVPSERLPEGQSWAYELKLDGYRALAFKSDGTVHLRSRNNRSFNAMYPTIVQALAELPDETIIDGEIVALDQSGRPSFGLLQNRSPTVTLCYYVFDVVILHRQNVMLKPLSDRRELLRSEILPRLADPIRQVPQFDASLADLIHAVRQQGFEGLVAKRLDSCYEPGQRSGAWRKMRVNQSGEFVIGGYTMGSSQFDALIFGQWQGDQLMYAGRTRSGFTSASRDQLHQRFQGLETLDCPFANLPESHAGRWGEGLTAEKMKHCRWLTPVLSAKFEFVEWTADKHLRHSRFVSLAKG